MGSHLLTISVGAIVLTVREIRFADEKRSAGSLASEQHRFWSGSAGLADDRGDLQLLSADSRLWS